LTLCKRCNTFNFAFTYGKAIVKISFKGKKGGGKITRNELEAEELAHVALSLNDKNLYISDGKDNVLVVDASTLETTNIINMPTGLDDMVKIVKDELGKSWYDSDSNPHGLAVHPGGRYVYVLLVWSGAVAVIAKTESGEFKVIHTIKVGEFPNGISTRFGKNQNS